MAETLRVLKDGVTLGMADNTSMLCKADDEVPLDKLSEAQRKLVEDEDPWLFGTETQGDQQGVEPLVEVSGGKKAAGRRKTQEQE